MDGSLCSCILFFLPSGWWFGSFHWHFPPYCVSFIPSSHHFPLQIMQGIWVKFPSSVSGKRPVVLSLKPGPGSSIRSLNLQDPLPPSVGHKVPPPSHPRTKLTQRDAILTAPKSFPAYYHKAGKTRLWSQRRLIAPWYRGHYMFPGSKSQRCSSSQ